MRVAYINLSAGASGDMIVGAMVHAGLSRPQLKDTIKKLKLRGVSIKISRVEKNHLPGISIHVAGGGRLNPREMQRRIAHASLPTAVRDRAQAILRYLIEAESKAHNKDARTIHFHQMSEPDTIVDIVCAAVGIEQLGISRLCASPVHTGFLAPATAYILKKIKAKIYIDNMLHAHEMITPTGAAILAGCNVDFSSLPVIDIESIGFGAGERNFGGENQLLQLIVGTISDEEVLGNDRVLYIETNIDDMDPRVYPYVIDKLLKNGAYDAWYSQVIMKKGRPGITIRVLCSHDKFETMKYILLRETTTLGIRFISMQRYCLPRWHQGNTKYGIYKGNIKKTIEFEKGLRIAKQKKIPLHEVLKKA